MLTVTPGDIEAALLPLIPQLATRVPDDILSGLVAARETETGARARIVLDQLVQNACVAAKTACLSVKTRVRYGCAWKPALTCWFLAMCSLV